MLLSCPRMSSPCIFLFLAAGRCDRVCVCVCVCVCLCVCVCVCVNVDYVRAGPHPHTVTRQTAAPAPVALHVCKDLDAWVLPNPSRQHSSCACNLTNTFSTSTCMQPSVSSCIGFMLLVLIGWGKRRSSCLKLRPPPPPLAPPTLLHHMQSGMA